jgi:hypothetical protein
MPSQLMEEAARLLERETTRTLEADTLYVRARRGVHTDQTLGTFVDSLRAQPDRFTVITTTCAVLPDHGWDERDRIRYRKALEDAGIAASIVALAEEPAEPLVTRPPTGSAAVLRDVHDAVAVLARANGEHNSALHELAARAIEQLQAVSRALPP